MILESIVYNQYKNTSRGWSLENCKFKLINLIVGKNATGKSKTLSLIRHLANMVCGEQKLTFIDGDYKVTFKDGEKLIFYELLYRENNIVKEQLKINNKIFLDREANGKGKIYYEKINRKLNFKIPQNKLAVYEKRDQLQHPFLEDLYDWGKSLIYYQFGSDLGQNFVILQAKEKLDKLQELNLKNTNKVVDIFLHGTNKFPTRFVKTIIKDMAKIGYNFSNIDVEPLKSILVIGGISQVFGLSVKEEDLNDITDQKDMSQGMFRCLSIIIQIEYLIYAEIPCCILIDDIGEGLDYERSSALVKLLVDIVKKARNKPVQLIMATNDRFVMNSIPIKYWSVIHRIGGKSIIYNYENSPKLFKEFEFKGLNNFDFFTTKYYLQDKHE